MTDADYGSRDDRGYWTPFKGAGIAPLFSWPWRPLKTLKWVFAYPGFLLPWNLFFALVAVGVWYFLTPPLETLKTFEVGWIAYILCRNAAMILVFYGAIHMRLYMQRAQDKQFKYNPNWLETDNPKFVSRKQTFDNMIWTFGSGLPIWTAYEVITLWLFANGYVPYLDPAGNPVWFIALMFLIPLMREFHFYWIHRLIHWPPLYHSVHKLHHHNTNPGPWSSLAMHPVEHLIYFSGVIVHWVLISHPIHALYHMIHAGLGAIVGHIGFHKMVAGGDKGMDTHAFAHYLHHKYFEVNYGEGTIPLDKAFGTWHDGSREAEQRMNARMREHARGKRRARAA